MSKQNVLDSAEFRELSWDLIGYKLAYYYPEKLTEEALRRFEITDAEYDSKEVRYLELCRGLNKPNTLVHKEYPSFEDIDFSGAMMEVDFKRSSVQLVLNRFGKDIRK